MPLTPLTASRSARLVAVISAVGALPGCALGWSTWQGGLSDHFDGRHFHNVDRALPTRGVTLGGLPSALRWAASKEPGPWRPFHDEPPGPPPPARVDGRGLRVTFINHATALVQLGGLNILTDPIYAQRCSPVGFVGPQRVRPPGVRFEDLPPIDAVVLSHDHYDHLDLPTLERLAQRFPKVTLFVPAGMRAAVASVGAAGVVELDWWQSLALGAVRFTAVPAQHNGYRGPFDAGDRLWAGWVLESAAAGRVFFAGDTGFSGHFAQVRERLGAPRVALLPIGAYRPEWFMAPMHLSPAQAVEAAGVLQAEHSVPIHFGTFNLADDGEEEPLAALAAARAPGSARFDVLDFGGALSLW